jgi:hypothetical protein
MAHQSGAERTRVPCRRIRLATPHGKLHIREVHQGVEFPGAFLKPYRDYVSRSTFERIILKLQQLDLQDEVKAQRTIDSYLGILSHTASYRMAQSIGLSKPLAA